MNLRCRTITPTSQTVNQPMEVRAGHIPHLGDMHSLDLILGSLLSILAVEGDVMRKILSIAAVIVSLAGCASQIMSGYVGQPITAVIAQYGMPSGSYDLEPGKRAFVWQMENSVIIPGSTTTTGTVVGNQIFTNSYNSGGYVATSTCAYVLHAQKTRDDVEGPAAWTIVGYDKPRFDCE